VSSDDETGWGFLSRRGFLQVSAVPAFDFHLPRWLDEWRALGKRPEAKRVTPFITPNGAFYLVAVDPSFRPRFDEKTAQSRWTLKVEGVDGKSGSFGYRELLARARKKIHYTFECIGNDVGGQLISNAEWHVLPLRDLLAEAPGGTDHAHSVMFTGLDDFYSSVFRERALDPDAFLALRMNGVPLPPAHGFPARVILPDLYGMKQPRWLRGIKLQATRHTTSYWEERGWGGEVPVKTMSRLDPRPEVPANKQVPLTGVAFAGERGVAKVQVSLDGGSHWVDCQLVTPTTPGVWSLWRYEWNRPTPGRYRLSVRAVDGTGALQTARHHQSFPDGASGYDEETARVASKDPNGPSREA